MPKTVENFVHLCTGDHYHHRKTQGKELHYQWTGIHPIYTNKYFQGGTGGKYQKDAEGKTHDSIYEDNESNHKLH